MAVSETDLLEVPTTYHAYVKENPHKIQPYMVEYLHFGILPLIYEYSSRAYMSTSEYHGNIPERLRVINEISIGGRTMRIIITKPVHSWLKSVETTVNPCV